MKRLQSTAPNFVPAEQPLFFPLRALWRGLRSLWRPRTLPARPQPAPARPVLPMYLDGTPDHVLRVRAQGQQALWLLTIYARKLPTSRRACGRLGMPDGVWREARDTLKRAGVMSRDGTWLYTPRDSMNRLEVYMRDVEYRARASGRYVAP